MLAITVFAEILETDGGAGQKELTWLSAGRINLNFYYILVLTPFGPSADKNNCLLAEMCFVDSFHFAAKKRKKKITSCDYYVIMISLCSGS